MSEEKLKAVFSTFHARDSFSLINQEHTKKRAYFLVTCFTLAAKVSKVSDTSGILKVQEWCKDTLLTVISLAANEVTTSFFTKRYIFQKKMSIISSILHIIEAFFPTLDCHVVHTLLQFVRLVCIDGLNTREKSLIAHKAIRILQQNDTASSSYIEQNDKEYESSELNRLQLYAFLNHFYECKAIATLELQEQAAALQNHTERIREHIPSISQLTPTRSHRFAAGSFIRFQSRVHSFSNNASPALFDAKNALSSSFQSVNTSSISCPFTTVRPDIVGVRTYAVGLLHALNTLNRTNQNLLMAPNVFSSTSILPPNTTHPSQFSMRSDTAIGTDTGSQTATACLWPPLSSGYTISIWFKILSSSTSSSSSSSSSSFQTGTALEDENRKPPTHPNSLHPPSHQNASQSTCQSTHPTTRPTSPMSDTVSPVTRSTTSSFDELEDSLAQIEVIQCQNSTSSLLAHY